MRLRFPAVIICLGFAVIDLGSAASGGLSHTGIAAGRAAVFPNDDKTIVHVLNRVGFGPRDGDVARVREIGLQRYLEDQLHAERIADTAMSARLSGLTTLAMSSREIAETYEIPQLQARREKRQEAAQASMSDAAKPPAMPDPLQQKANRVVIELAEQKMLRAVYSDRQLQEVLTD